MKNNETIKKNEQILKRSKYNTTFTAIIIIRKKKKTQTLWECITVPNQISNKTDELEKNSEVIIQKAALTERIRKV